MDTLIVHSGTRQGRFAEVIRATGDTLRIGRGYGNDLVISDIHIAPEQLVLRRQDEQWWLHVLDQTNPVLLNDEVVGDTPVPVKSGDKLTLGRTRLGLYSPDHPVEKTRKLMLSSWLERYSGSALAPLLFLAGAGLLDLALGYFETSTELTWEGYGYDVLFMCIVVVVWAGVWAVTGRIVRHHSQFGLQLMATSAAYALLTVLSVTGIYLVYPAHSVLADEALAWSVALVALTVLIRLNLVIASHVERPLRVALGASAATLLVWFALLQLGLEDDFSTVPEYSSTLKPPAFNPGDGVSAEAYFAALAEQAAHIE